MKKLFITLIATILLSPIFAQSEHLTFKGIPIDGSLTDFTTQMKQKSFTHIATEDGTAAFVGEFASYKNCTIGVLCSKSTKIVNKVGVIFPKCDTWSKLYSNYSHLKEMLTIKYGEPTESTEKFQSYTEPTDDITRMSYVKYDNCKYTTSWVTEKGTIELEITHQDYDCHVVLHYWDKINTEKVTNSAIDDL